MQKEKMTYIAIVDDKKQIRNALQERLAETENLKVVFMAENGNDFLEKMRESHKIRIPDLVLMDIDMPLMTGIEAVSIAKDIYPNSKFIMLTIFDEDEKIFEAIKAGADGYLLKDEPVEKIKEAIRVLLDEGGAPMSPAIARKALQLLMQAKSPIVDKKNEEPSALTYREQEILKHLVDGLEYKEIAQISATSPNTIRNQVSNIYKKLHVSSKAQAINLALKKRWF
jgi:DNA-binding NarL/FixJ family response regulator